MPKLTLEEMVAGRIRREEEFSEHYKKVLATVAYKEHAHEEVWPQDMPRVYTVTTIARRPAYGGNRTPVVCATFDMAQELVLSNAADMWECSYMFAVITVIPLDFMYPDAAEFLFPEQGPYVREYWYKWDLEQSCYRPIEKVEGLGGCPID